MEAVGQAAAKQLDLDVPAVSEQGPSHKSRAMHTIFLTCQGHSDCGFNQAVKTHQSIALGPGCGFSLAAFSVMTPK